MGGETGKTATGEYHDDGWYKEKKALTLRGERGGTSEKRGVKIGWVWLVGRQAGRWVIIPIIGGESKGLFHPHSRVANFAIAVAHGDVKAKVADHRDQDRGALWRVGG